jgi:signal peptidase II
MRRYAQLALVALTALVLDQGTKYLAVNHLTRLASNPEVGSYTTAKHLYYLAQPPVVVTSFWEFHYAENPGAAWSFLANTSEAIRIPFFYAVALLAGLVILYFFRESTPEQGLRRLALSMVLGGALGNTADRVLHGYVVDFIAWHYGPYYWPTFNVADCFVCVGVGLLLTEGLFQRQAARPGSQPA